MANSTPKPTGHPAMPNIMALAQHKSKIIQGRQKMQYELLKGQVHAKKTNADIKKLKTQVETGQVEADTQMKLLKAKTKAQSDQVKLKQQAGQTDLEYKKQAHKHEREVHNWKKKTQPRKKTTPARSASKTAGRPKARKAS